MRAGANNLPLTLAAVLIAAAAGCRRTGASASDSGQDVPASFDTAADSAGAAGSSGSSGGQGGASGTAGTAVGGAAGGGGALGGIGGGTSGTGGGGGVSGTSGGGGTAGTGGAAPPLFPCIGSWPARPAGVQKAAPLSVSPGTLWTKDLPLNGSPVSLPMAVTGNGVALSFGDRLLIYDGDGNPVASVTKPQSVQGGKISSPVAGPDGSLYFADRSYAYRVDGMGRSIWQQPLGADQTAGRSPAPRAPALDPAGRLFVSALDGKLWTFRGEDGQVLGSIDLGVWQNNARYINSGFGIVFVVDRSGIATAGPAVAAYGLMSADGGGWVGEIPGQGLYVIGGYDLGVLVARGTDTSDVSIFDRCGNFRWRVPGSYVVPLAITFEDDLIIMDRTPLGGGTYSFALRRFSRDGALVAGPISVSDTFCGWSFVGADDTFYYTGGAQDGYRLRAFDSSLRESWVIPFPHCSDAAVLGPGGKILTARGSDGKLVAVQTTSPGPAPVSWGQIGRDARATRWLAP